MKVAIITMFYRSVNYGGILQSYALVKTIEKNHIACEQLCYNSDSVFPPKQRMKRRVAKILFQLKKIKYLPQMLKIHGREKKVRKASMQLVKHSKRVFTENSIRDCVDNFSCFITGSDQVWHGEWPAYFLAFVPKGKKKIAYAASTGKNNLSDDDYKKMKRYLSDYDSISVREADIADALNNAISNKKVELVLDPTLLLEREEWYQLVSPRAEKRKYLFCYYLGTDKCIRELAKEYAKAHGLIIITIPHMQGKIEETDLAFGDVQLFNATPQDFLSYINDASIIFTDSFHATVFSLIFQKQFVSFGRENHKEMNNRLETLTELFHLKERFLSDRLQFNIESIESLATIDYSVPFEQYEALKIRSIDFLMKSLQS